MALKAVTICGSKRQGSNNRRLQHVMNERLSARGIEVIALDMAQFDLPLFDADLEAQGTPQAAIDLAALFLDADIIFIATPEYNGSVTPLIKNTIDWISRQKGRPFRRAVFGIGAVSTGRLSGVSALSHLRDILSKLMALVAPIDLRIGPAEEAFNAQGHLIEASIEKRADLLADELVRLATAKA